MSYNTNIKKPNDNTAGYIPTEPVCRHDRLRDETDRSAEYFIPDLGTLHMRYDGDYGIDRDENNLDPAKFKPSVVLCYGVPYLDIVFDGFIPAILPNPDKLTFATGYAQPVKELITQLGRASRALYEANRIINIHFPTEKRRSDG